MAVAIQPEAVLETDQENLLLMDDYDLALAPLCRRLSKFLARNKAQS